MTFTHTLALLADTAAGAAKPEQPGNQFQMMILMAGVIFMLFYFIIQRPQKREQKKVEDMRNSLRKGDKVVTIGGIHGVVQGVDSTNNIVTVQVDKNVKIDFSNAAISTVTRKDEEKSAS